MCVYQAEHRLLLDAVDDLLVAVEINGAAGIRLLTGGDQRCCWQQAAAVSEASLSSYTAVKMQRSRR